MMCDVMAIFRPLQQLPLDKLRFGSRFARLPARAGVEQARLRRFVVKKHKHKCVIHDVLSLHRRPTNDNADRSSYREPAGGSLQSPPVLFGRRTSVQRRQAARRLSDNFWRGELCLSSA